jgi:hypothetical protein
MTTATYLYCIVRSARKPRGSERAAVPGGTAPSLLPVGESLWLVTSEVPLERYGPGPVSSVLQDLERVSEIALAHEAVVEQFARQRGCTVVPMKLFTMFSTPAKAVAEMRGRMDEIAPVLDRIAGAHEWGVRVVRRRGATPAGARVRATTGTAFLAARKQARDEVRETARQAAQAAEAAFDALAPLARASRRRDGAPAGAIPPLLDAAFLVPVRHRTRFEAEAQRLASTCARAGADMTVSGPWPAYNFVQPDEEGRA